MQVSSAIVELWNFWSICLKSTFWDLMSFCTQYYKCVCMCVRQPAMRTRNASRDR